MAYSKRVLTIAFNLPIRNGMSRIACHCNRVCYPLLVEPGERVAYPPRTPFDVLSRLSDEWH